MHPVVDDPIDLIQVRREIDAEVRARRAAGEYPPGFERELDALFDRFAPAEASEDFDVALGRAEEKVAVEPVIPTASQNPVLLVVKKVMSKLIGWYHVWLVQQITGLGATITHALRLLGRRVADVERATGDAARVRAEAARVAPVRDDDAWSAVVVGALRDVEGRVIVAECGDGALLAAIDAAGCDAYGVEPRSALADDAAARGLEVRVDDALGHLDSLQPGDLGAIVLRGCSERLTTGERLELADLATSRVHTGGQLVVCSIDPSAWGSVGTEVEADLVPGRPLHAATWQAILSERRCDSEVHRPAGEGSFVVVATRR